MGRVEARDHRLEQMHVRILPARQRDRQAFVDAAVRRAQMAVEEGEQCVDLGANLRILVERIDGRQRKQDEGVVVGVAPAVQHRALRRQPVHVARPAVGRFRACEQMLQPLERDGAPLRIPAHLRGLGVAPDLAGLHEHAPRRGHVRRAVMVQPIDETTRAMVPADRRPQRQRLVDHAALQARDDVRRLARRNDSFVRHHVLFKPRQWPSDTHAGSGAQRMPTRKDQP
ncbi:hypothetical protein ACVWW2_006125 [Bradyrhizobium sp. LM4.3]